ncbi:hypothetical protein CAOG_009261 [Capsaspora owczarzaki ATCC 30864]|uniref:Uncharacterized protein n=1 Tax=Capsaspora owczarzaki (strain ATCC 30864) TaxID=595528 RepID=A0A0D2WG91_CAPO3|nr:hypothetical protein CAOG_009261 [Capsaspora owczarzaki ATCC 30864]
MSQQKENATTEARPESTDKQPETHREDHHLHHVHDYPWDHAYEHSSWRRSGTASTLSTEMHQGPDLSNENAGPLTTNQRDLRPHSGPGPIGTTPPDHSREYHDKSHPGNPV